MLGRRAAAGFERGVQEIDCSSGNDLHRIYSLLVDDHAYRLGSHAGAGFERAAQELDRVLGTRVRITAKTDQRGRIEIDYCSRYSGDEMQRIYSLPVDDHA